MKTILVITSIFFSLFDLNAKIIYVEPVQNAKYVSTNNSIIIGFDEKIESSNLSSLIRITGSQSGIHTGEIILTSDKTKLIFKPHQPFAFGEQVEVKLIRLKTLSASNNNLTYTFQTQSSKLKVDYNKIMSDELNNTSENNFMFSNDFSALPQIIVRASNNPTPGDLYLSNFRFSTIPHDKYIIIANNDGTIKYSRLMDARTTDFKKQPNGLLTYWSGIKYYADDSQHNLIDSFECGNGYSTDQHELIVDENNHAFLMSYDPQIIDMSQYVAGGNPNATVYGLIIQELDEFKNVVFQWRSWDHIPLLDGDNVNYTASIIDYVHGNAIEVDDDGHLLISSRHLSEITKINRITGEVMWRMGGGVGNQFTFPNDPIKFRYQHDIRRLPNGNVTLYDNGNYHSPPFSRAVEYQLDEVNKIATLVWQYRRTPTAIYGAAMGSVQRLSNGNTLISWGSTNPTITEVTPAGGVALELDLPFFMYTYRTFRDEGLSRDAGVTAVVNIPSDTVYTGTNICFDATVNNFGQSTLTSIPTYYTVNGGSSVDTVTFGAINAGGNTIANFCGSNSFTPASAGNYSLKFYTSITNDANNTNDTTTVILTVIDSAKDAGVSSAVSIPSGTIYTGTNLCFDATVKNLGQAYLASVPAYYTVDGGAPIGPVNATDLLSGDSSIVNFCSADSYTPASAGSYTLKFYTLLPDDVNGANDTATLVLTVIDSTRDAGISSAVSIPSGTIYTGTNLCFDATVKNFGQAYLASVTAYYTVDGGSPVGPVNASDLLSGDSSIVNFCSAESYTPASAGSYTLKFYTLLPDDINGANDTATLVLTVIDSAKDAGVSSAVSIPSGTIYTGTNLCFDATVKNFGQAYLASVTAYYTVDGGAPIGPVNATDLLSGDSSIVNFCSAESYTPASAGSYTLKFYTLLPDDINGANDTATLVLTVIDSAKDAGVSSAVSIPSGTIYTGENLCFDATVKNLGQAYLASVPAYYTVDGGAPIGPVNATDLLSGDSSIVNFCSADSYTPASAGSYTLKFYTLLPDDINGANDTTTLVLTVIDLLPSASNIKVIQEGFYNTTTKQLNISDTVKAYLHLNISPYNVIDSAVSVIDSVTFEGSFLFSNATNGTYYIVIKHRNTIETWSRAGGEVFIKGTTMNYDFTDFEYKAFQSNMFQVDSFPIRFAIFSGDADQDGFVATQDLAIIDNDVFNYVTGYVVSDITGNNVTDASDLSLADNNAYLFKSKMTPP